jgi:hypothetical protein
MAKLRLEERNTGLVKMLKKRRKIIQKKRKYK